MRRNLHINSSTSTEMARPGNSNRLDQTDFQQFQTDTKITGGTHSNGFELFNEEDRRRENAFKVILVVSLCITVCAWACLLTICPLLYQFLNFSTSQFNGMLQFCEETAENVASNSILYVESFASRQHSEFDHLGRAVNRTRNFRQVPTPYQLQHDNADNCRCVPETGARGTPGRRGMKGTPGTKGASGIPARLPCEPLQDLKKYCPEKCPQGPQGSPGQKGPLGEKGKTGVIGPAGQNGKDGKTGPRGMPGPPGVPGLDGEDGDGGTDAIPTPFIPGPPGPQGQIGPEGPAGPSGLPGQDGPSGAPGKRGVQGDPGKIGTPGLPGNQGPIGEPGMDGHKGVCPTYCAMDGGVFFVEPPEWFFKNKKEQ